VLDAGRILVAGFEDVTKAPDALLVARFTSTGELDPTFAYNGVARVNLPGYLEAPEMTLDGGRIVLAVSQYAGHTYHGVVVRLAANGALDPTFGGDGISRTPKKRDVMFRDVLTDSDGRVIAAGAVGSDLGLARFRAEGGLDQSFGGDGLVVTDLGGGDDSIAAISDRPDGTLLAAGAKADHYSRGPSYTDLALVRYLLTDGPADADADGVLDSRDRCPNAFGARRSGCRLIRSRVSLYSSDTFDADVRARSGACRNDREVVLQEWDDKRWRTVDADTTDRYGDAEFGNAGAGTFRALITARRIPAKGLCGGDRSKPLRARGSRTRR
jgi:uncharacterized delta-60 repeat protein